MQTDAEVRNPRETSMLELATMVRDMVGSRAGIVHAPLPKDDPVRRNPDIGLAQKLLGAGWLDAAGSAGWQRGR